MPNLVRKLIICAAAEGLLLQPVGQRNQVSNSPVVKIDYKTHAISPSLHQSQDEDKNETLEAHGIIGLLKLASTSYLVSISRREQVAQIRGKPIYVITDVALIPLSSKSEAEKAILQARKDLSKDKTSTTETEDTDEEDETRSSTVAEETNDDDLPATPAPEKALDQSVGSIKKSSTIVSNVIKDKGRYGRFAEKWFSKSGWSATNRRNQGMSSEENLTREQSRQAIDALPDDKQEEETIAEPSALEDKPVPEGDVQEAEVESQQRPSLSHTESVMQALTPRIMRATKLYFASKSFYFSYDYDISRSLSRQEPLATTSSVPLFKRFDPLFFWNRSLINPFVEAGQNGLVLPIIQGFVGQRAFTVNKPDDDSAAKIVEATKDANETIEMQENAQAPTSATGDRSEDNNSKDFLLTLMSRRSVKRAGLRYLRRGVDDEGCVANSVETEQILSTPSWSSTDKVFSFVQIRGSIPLFFSQSPYSFKPIPIMYGSEATNQAAFKKHFSAVLQRYGNVQITSLVDKHGTEVKIGEAFEQHTKLMNDNGGLNDKSIGFEWFDFHSECRGMKFENVSILMNTLRPALSSYGWTIQENDKLTSTQSGVLRTNCMDCLDRTNVVQSATADGALQAQLEALGLSINLQTDPGTSWFNNLWADNGDAISRQYAGTAALKGDFTRTRKRNLTGALTDFSLTLNRYYNNIFGDYFLQTCIDYWLGNAGPTVFEEFETDMMSQDYALDMRRVRQSAIETCVRIVLEDPNEDMVAGWTLSCPHEANTLRSLPFEECVLLLTDAALYFCRFDWNTEKVGSYERVDLADIDALTHGVYITSTLGPTHLDEKKNVGFAVRYRPHGEAMVRTNTRALQNEKAASKADEDEVKTEVKPSESRVLAFKALPPRASARRESNSDGEGEISEVDLVQHVCGEIKRVAAAALARQSAFGKRADVGGAGDGEREGEKGLKVEENDIISVAEAKRSTGYLESLQYSLKKLVWS